MGKRYTRMDSVADNNDALIEYINNESNSINEVPENIFLHHFLPMFSGQVPLDDDKLIIWYRYSNGPFGTVWITRNGKRVIKIPPLKDRELVMPINSGHTVETGAIFLNYRNMNALSPTAANNKLAYELEEKFLTIPPPDAISQYEKEWDKVMEFYNIKKPAIKNNSKGNDSDDDFDYD
jgi:hypothetical protein